MAMTLTVRRRAVCALALLALLCGAGTVAAAAAPPVIVAVEVSCASADRKISWRVAGETTSAWKECPEAVEVPTAITAAPASQPSQKSGGSDFICAWAGTAYLSAGPRTNCAAASAGGTQNVALTMHCATDDKSELHTLAKGQIVTVTGTDASLHQAGDCALQTTTAREAALLQPSQGHSSPPQAAASPTINSAPSGPTPEGSTAAAGERSSQAPAGRQETSTENRPATATPLAGTAAQSTAAAGKAADGAAITTTTATRSPSDGGHTKSNADGGDAILFLRAPLLLLVAALACTAA
ncbi:mucin-like glycoprotein [Trypanosoma conorhini]|uniref:Mucin-like glycoprotein n=1 Tax=Trypanosoma conorhini TaxID=83891 RepID=A0A3R7PZZ9_9TRYP|nr:mucin-like glycoprotein [Trypanosoma conorhini]RNF27617.1 mucin-like glycoprotein [Trypanosoma conorhini]